MVKKFNKKIVYYVARDPNGTVISNDNKHTNTQGHYFKHSIRIFYQDSQCKYPAGIMKLNNFHHPKDNATNSGIKEEILDETYTFYYNDENKNSLIPIPPVSAIYPNTPVPGIASTITTTLSSVMFYGDDNIKAKFLYDNFIIDGTKPKKWNKHKIPYLRKIVFKAHSKDRALELVGL